MRAFLTLLLFIGSLCSYGADFDCESEFLREAKELLASDNQNLLSLQFQVTTLKLSKKAVENNKTNLEALVRQYSRQLKNGDQKVLHRLEELYSKHGKNDDYSKIIENFGTARYWNKETRFYNQDISMFILAKKTLDPDEKDLDERDAAITWLAGKLSNESGRKNSSKFNLTNMSSHIASIAGAIKGYPKITLPQVKGQIKELTNKLAKAFEDLKQNLSVSFKANCLDEAGKILSCRSEDDLLALSVKELAQDIGRNKIYQFSLESEVKSRFGGNVEFKLRTNLQEHARQKAWLAKYPPAPQRIDYPYSGYEAVSQRKRWQKSLNQLSDEQKIKGFNQENGKVNYGILDKGKKVLTIYSKEGLVLASTTVLLKKPHHDDKEGSGSGIYSISKLGPSLQLTDERGGNSKLTLGNQTLECQIETCFPKDGSGKGEELIQRYLFPNGPLYILPYDKANHFEIKNNKLNHTTDMIIGPFFKTNFTPKGKHSFPIEIEISDPRYKTKTAQEFMETLEKEKETLMKLYALDNDEYNELAEYAFGIMGNESEFGENWRYDVKESFPFGVAWLKDTKKNLLGKTKKAYNEADGFWSGVGSGASTYFKELISRDVRMLTGQITSKGNSRGPTQIKRVPKKIQEFYGVDKDNISKPRNSAVATMGFLAEAMVELKNRSRNNPAITKENRMDYLHYIYMGSTHEIKNRTATPDKNIYLRQLKEYLGGISIFQKTI